MGTSNRNIVYACTLCEREVSRDLLTIKRVQFTDLNGKVTKTRVVGWLCEDCLSEDFAYQLPARATAPGMKDTKIAVEVP